MYIPAWTSIVLLCLVFSLGILLTYVIGVSQGHFRPVFPYISDTGAYPIENGFFVLVFALTVFFLILVIYIRFKDLLTHVEGIFYRITNVVFLIIGISVAFFLMSISAFQYDDSPLSLQFHFAAAILTIFLNYVYSFGQTFLGLLLPPKRVWWKWLVFAIQITITIIGIILFLYYFGSSFAGSYQYYVSIGTNTSSIDSNSTLLSMYNDGLAIDYSRAVVQWTIFAEVLLFYVTLIPDFHRIRVCLEVTRPFGESSGKNNDKELKRV